MIFTNSGSEINFFMWAPTGELVSNYKLLVAREQIMVAKTSPWRLGNVQLILIVTVVKVSGRFVSLLD